jgi:L-rhamnose isomerase
LVTEIEIKHTMAILEGAVPIEVIVSLVSEIENIYSGTLMVDLKAITPTRTEATLLRGNQMRSATRYRVILRAAASYLK